MQTFAKKPLHWAVAAALTGLGSAAPMGEALAQDTNVGQALVFPYYTVNNGWVTTLKAINTSDYTLAVKVRFHESKNSRDVLDFNIVMSPYDVWSGWVQESEDGAPEIHTADNSCTSPQVIDGAEASAVAYTGAFDDTGGSGNGRMRDGYVEMLVMGVALPGWEDATSVVNGPIYPTAYYAKHVDGVPRDCAKVDAAFYPKAPNWTAGTAPTALAPAGLNPDTWCQENVNPENFNYADFPGSGYPLAACDFLAPVGAYLSGETQVPYAVFPLKGNLTWLHAGTGTGAGTEAIAVGTGTAGDFTPVWSYLNQVTAQLFPWFLEPTFASTNGLWTVTAVGDFEQAVAFQSTLNEWADNPANGAAVDWVINFPTKGFHVDWFNEQIQAAVSRYRTADVNGAVVTTTGTPADVTDAAATDCNNDRTKCKPVDPSPVSPVELAPFQYLFGQQGTGDSKVTVTYNLWNSEEGGKASGSTTISPAPPGEIESLRWEANVLQFSTEPVLDSPKAVEVDASAALDGATNGWSRVDFTGSTWPVESELAGSVPVVGFAIKERDRGDPSTAYGQAMDNGYISPYQTEADGLVTPP